MRVLVPLLLIGAAAAGLAACNRPAASGAAAPGAQPLALNDMPHRKAGLWRQTMHMEGVDRPMPAIEACTDEASEAKLNLLGQHKSKDLCQNQDFSRSPDGSIHFSVSCDLGAHGRTASTGTISGDFASHYRIAMASKTTGAPLAQMNSEHKMVIDATWIGPCAPGQRGGDMIMADGRKVNLTAATPNARYP
jgi:hypothetical protein